MFRRLTPLIAILSLALAQPSLAQNGVLRFGAVTVQGDVMRVPVSLEGDLGDGVSAMDFRIFYDPDVFEPISVQPGPAAQAADKLVQANVIGPGEYIVLMFGMNQSTLGSGEAVQVAMRVLNEPSAGQTELRIANTTMSLPNATDIPSHGTATTVWFSGGVPGSTPPEDATQPEQSADGADGTELPDGDADRTGNMFARRTGQVSGQTALDAPAGEGRGRPAPREPGVKLPNPNVGERLGSLKELVEKMRQADGLRAQMPAGGTGIQAGEPDKEGKRTPQDTPISPEEKARTRVARDPAVPGPQEDPPERESQVLGVAARAQGVPPAAAPADSDAPRSRLTYLALAAFGAAAILAYSLLRRRAS